MNLILIFFYSYFWFIFQIWCLPEMPEIQRWRTDLTGNVSDFDNGKRSLGLISTKTLISINLWDVVRRRSDVILKISYYHSLFWSGDMTFFNQSLIVRLTNVNTSYLLNRLLIIDNFFEILFILTITGLHEYLRNNTFMNLHFISNFHSGSIFGENLSWCEFELSKKNLCVFYMLNEM